MQVVIELPYVFIQTVIYGVIVYTMIGFDWTISKFFWYIFFMYFTFLYFTFYGMMTVGFTPNHHIAAIVSSSFFAIWNLFSGFIIPRTVSSPVIYITNMLIYFIENAICHHYLYNTYDTVAYMVMGTI